MTSLAQYIESLNVVVGLAPAESWAAEDIAAFLTKTRGFNVKPGARNGTDISAKIERGGVTYHWLTAMDRLGDYGNAGIVAVRCAQDELVVEELALDCRVLGKRVELQLLTHLVALAREKEERHIVIWHAPTEVDDVVGRFLASLATSPSARVAGRSLKLLVDDVAEFARGKTSTNGVKQSPSAPFSLASFCQQRWSRLSPRAREERVWKIATELRREEDLVDALAQAAQTVRRRDTQPYVAPRDALEQLLVSIWSAVLDVEKVGIHDHFFDLGGHSLLITQVLARIHEALEMEVPIHRVFRAPTVALLAECLAPTPARRSQLSEEAELVMGVSSMSSEEVELAIASRRTS